MRIKLRQRARRNSAHPDTLHPSLAQVVIEWSGYQGLTIVEWLFTPHILPGPAYRARHFRQENVRADQRGVLQAHCIPQRKTGRMLRIANV